MATPTPDPWVTLVLGVLSTGSLKYAYDAFRAWRAEAPKELRLAGIEQANIASVARARDELGEDVTRLREMLADERAQRIADEARHATDRARWLFDQERLRADVARLEAQIRQERSEANVRLQAEQARANERYDALLAQVTKLGVRTDEMKDRRDG